MAKNSVRDCLFITTEISTKENGLMTKKMGLESIFIISTKSDIMVCGRTTKETGREITYMATGIGTEVNSSME